MLFTGGYIVFICISILDMFLCLGMRLLCISMLTLDYIVILCVHGRYSVDFDTSTE